MNKSLKKEIKKYLREVNRNIICDFKTRRKYIGDLKASVYDYIDETNSESIVEVYSHFGTPQEIAKAFFENADIRKIKKRMNLTKVFLIGIIIALVMWAGTLIYAVIDANYFSNEYDAETIHNQNDYSFVLDKEGGKIN